MKKHLSVLLALSMMFGFVSCTADISEGTSTERTAETSTVSQTSQTSLQTTSVPIYTKTTTTRETRETTTTAETTSRVDIWGETELFQNG